MSGFLNVNNRFKRTSRQVFKPLNLYVRNVLRELKRDDVSYLEEIVIGQTEGLYLKGNVFPIVENDLWYKYEDKNTGFFTSFRYRGVEEDIYKIVQEHGNLYSESGRLLLTRNNIIYLEDRTLNPNAYFLTICIIRDIINRKTQFVLHDSNEYNCLNYIREGILPNKHDIDYETKKEHLLNDLFDITNVFEDQIDDFVNGDYWNLYTTKSHYPFIELVKRGDYETWKRLKHDEEVEEISGY